MNSEEKLRTILLDFKRTTQGSPTVNLNSYPEERDEEEEEKKHTLFISSYASERT